MQTLSNLRMLLLCVFVTSTLQAQEDSHQLAEVGTAISMSWAKAGNIINDVRDVPEMATRLAQATVNRVELRTARLKFFGVATMYETANRLRVHQITKEDVSEIYKAFMAGLNDDEDAKGEVMLRALTRGAELAIREQQREQFAALAVKSHVDIWRNDMLPVVKSLAASEADFQPCRVSIERSTDRRKTGLKMRNVSGCKLTNVTVAIDSTIGSANEGSVTHFVFLPTWQPAEEIRFPWRLAAGVTTPNSNPKMGDRITFSMWSSEYSLTNQSYKLPENIKVTSKPTYRLNLVQVGGPTGQLPRK